MQVVLLVAALVLVGALIVGGRWAWRKHEEEAIYERSGESESHKRDPFFQERLSDFFHGGGGFP